MSAAESTGSERDLAAAIRTQYSGAKMGWMKTDWSCFHSGGFLGPTLLIGLLGITQCTSHPTPPSGYGGPPDTETGGSGGSGDGSDTDGGDSRDTDGGPPPGDSDTGETSGGDGGACDVDDVSGARFGDADFRAGPDPGVHLPVVRDRFDRVLNDYGVNLLDWQGYLANPYVRLRLQGPVDASYPVQLTMEARGSSRFMFDEPSTLSADGASATRTVSDSSEQVEVLIEIHPDRGGEFEVETYRLVVRSQDAEGDEQVVDLPVRVLDQDEAEESPSIPIHIDTRYDNLSTRYFEDPEILAAATQAIEDWFYFFDLEPFDEVPAGGEHLSLAGVDWMNHETVSNDEPYRGMWVFLRSFSGPYSTGYPANNGAYHRRSGVEVPGPIHRSVAHILHLYEDATPFTSLDDDRWYETDLGQVTDIYGLVMHEFGHAIVFEGAWAGMRAHHDSGGANAEEVIAYQGYPVPIDDSYHVPGDEMYWDRLSGQNGGWVHRFPTRRWMNTKLNLLLAEEVGWPLDRRLSPFVKPSILTDSLPDAHVGCGYRYSLAAEGGVPLYDWAVVGGELPPGFTLDRYTGTLVAEGSVDAPAGTYAFTVRMTDHDELSAPAEASFELEVQGAG